ncbi:hypothetical protein BGZ46_007073 [Entomortierella lignicola]|nr:hypothetical protein BGZ46_007073 [Entomortierella lignicola]
MPVQFSPAKITADSLDSSLEPITQQELFKSACYDQYNISNEIFQSSFSGQLDILPKSNGFVETLTTAYNHHRGLIIRPDDVWVAILVQFNFFVNANAELLRKQFVSHQGQKSLKVTAAGNRYNVDFGKMAQDMTREIDNNVVDPSLRAWILPKFTTTTDNDTIVSSVVMMATMKKYFKYSFSLMCGLPRVTLEGEKSDWEEILGRLEKLKEYGIKTTAWYHLLKPVISRFVKAFDDPNGAENLDFWGRICHRTGGGSGPTFLGGWITAFCAFDSDGNWMGQQFIDESAAPAELSSLSASDFFAKYTRKTGDQELLVIDGTPYHVVDTNDIPNGYAEVNVTLDDNGLEIESKMAAGHVGMQVCSSGDKQLSSTGDRDTIKPASGWWMFSTLPEGQIKKDTDTY